MEQGRERARAREEREEMGDNGGALVVQVADAVHVVQVVHLAAAAGEEHVRNFIESHLEKRLLIG